MREKRRERPRRCVGAPLCNRICSCRSSIRFFSVGQKNFLRQRRCCAILLRRFVLGRGRRYAERCPSWPKEHDWKSCMPQKGIWGSNPHLSARLIPRAPLRAHRPCGGVAEWLNAAVSKTVSPVLPVTRVRIPPPPPFSVPIYSRIQAPFSLFTLALVSSLTQSVARSPFLPQRCRQYDIIPPCATEFASANFDNFRVSPVQLFVTIC